VIVTVGILLLVLAGVALLMRQRSNHLNEHEWDSYLSRKIESTERLLGPMARSFSRSGAVARMVEGQRGPEVLRRDLELGGAFNGSLQIFYSMQLAALVVSSCLMALSFLEGITSLNRLVFVGIAVIVAVWPYNRIRSTARQKSQTVLNELPDFAELLLMTITSTAVVNALSFTVEHSSGQIAAEMRELVRLLKGAGRGREQEAFALTASRLGTVEGREFVAALQSAYLEGTTAAANIKAQVENLRMLKFQQQRSRAKRLPVSLVVTFAIHFMPMLFILAFLPVLSSLAGLG
jgi:hypothetical protein